MKSVAIRSRVLVGVGFLGFAVRAPAAVTLAYTSAGSTSTSTTVAPGQQFAFSVDVASNSSSDQISGADYQIRASTSNAFEFISRNSSVGQFTSPNGFSDAYLNSSSYSPHVLSPTNGTDLGTSLADSNATVAGSAGTSSYLMANYVFQVLSGTVPGIYTLSFSNADYTGAPPSYPTTALTPTSTYTISVGATVPEPALIGAALVAGGAVLLTRRRR